MASAARKTVFYLAHDMPTVESQRIGPVEVASFTSRCPDHEGQNEDAALLCQVDSTRAVVAIADGFGGHASGARASEIAVRVIGQCVSQRNASDDPLRPNIIDGFEKANQSIIELGVGAATTLAVVYIEGHHVRCFHVGDSEVLLVGQRGRVKMRSVSHSPVGYAVASGLIDEKEVLDHEERHVVSNMVGSPDMRIEVGPSLELSARDTLLLSSDGLTDNVTFEDLVDLIRKGPLVRSLRTLVNQARSNMERNDARTPSKPDDLTVIALRRPRR